MEPLTICALYWKLTPTGRLSAYPIEPAPKGAEKSDVLEGKTMRDPNRIPRVIHLLERLWLLYPDLRLFQFLSWIRAEVILSAPKVKDPFFLEDDLSEETLTKLLEELEASGPAQVE